MDINSCPEGNCIISSSNSNCPECGTPIGNASTTNVQVNAKEQPILHTTTPLDSCASQVIRYFWAVFISVFIYVLLFACLFFYGATNIITYFSSGYFIWSFPAFVGNFLYARALFYNNKVFIPIALLLNPWLILLPFWGIFYQPMSQMGKEFFHMNCIFIWFASLLGCFVGILYCHLYFPAPLPTTENNIDPMEQKSRE
ncbi:hypothetical protein ACFL35_09930 [Candidatus Riflebacteria bacterium]